jgi:hypothetical protein
MMEIPLPTSTPREIVEETAKWIDSVYQESIRQATQGEVLRCSPVIHIDVFCQHHRSSHHSGDQ